MGELARAHFVCIECIGGFQHFVHAGNAIYYRGIAGKAGHLTPRPRAIPLRHPLEHPRRALQ